MAVEPLSVKKQGTSRVNPLTGLLAKPDIEGVTVSESFIELPPAYLQSIDINTERKAEAVVYAPGDTLDDATDAPVVVFLHGFSQRPRNYETTLRMLAARGAIVLAPRVWLLDIASPFTRIEGASQPGKRFTSPPAKLQTALLIDGLRCVQIARDVFGSSSVSLLGHSMGGAMALIAARALYLDAKPATSVLSLSPAIGPTVRTAVNDLLALDDKAVGVKGLKEFCGSTGPVPILLVHGARDTIVRKKDMNELFSAVSKERESKALALRSEITQGSHIGYEDSLNVDLPVLRILDVILFKIIDFLVFGPFDLFLDTADQLKFTKSLLRVWMDATKDGKVDADQLYNQVQNLKWDDQDLSYTWDGVVRES